MNKKLMLVVVASSVLVSACSTPCRRVKKLREVTETQNRVITALVDERGTSETLKKVRKKNKEIDQMEDRLGVALRQLLDSNKVVVKTLGGNDED